MSAALVRRRSWLLLAGLLLAGAGAVGLKNLKVDTDVSSLYPQDDPTLRLTRALQGDAGPQKSLVVVLRASRAAELEAVLPAAVSALRASPHLERVAATLEEFGGERRAWMARSPSGHLPAGTLEELERRLAGPGRAEQVARIRGRLAEDPVGGKQLVLADPLDVRWTLEAAAEQLASRFPARRHPGTPYLLFEQPALAFVRATGRKLSFDTAFSKELVADVSARLAAACGPAVTVELSGGYAIAAFQARAMQSDLGWQISSSAVLVLIFLFAYCRGLLAPHLLILPVGAGIVGTLALGAWWLGPLTPLALSVGAILIGQGIDYPIHVYARFRAELAGRSGPEAMERVLATLGRPMLGAMATTVLPTLILLWSLFPGVRQFGAILAIGMAACVAATVLFLVPLMVAAERRLRGSWEVRPWVIRGALALHDSRARVPAALLVLVLGLAGWGVVAAKGVRFDLDPRGALAQGDPAIAALEGLDRDLGLSVTPVVGLLPAEAPLERLRAGAASLRASGVAPFTDGPHELVPSPEGSARAEAFRRKTAGWVEGTLADLKAAGFAPGPFRKGLEDFDRALGAPPADIADLARPEFARLKGQFTVELEGRTWWVTYLFPARTLWKPADRAAFDAAARAALGPELRLYSAAHLPDHYAGRLLADLGRLGSWSFGTVVVLAVLAAGGIGRGLAALGPVALASGAALGAEVLAGGTLNLFNLVAVPIVIGVGVDNGIYLVSHWRESGGDARQALAECGPGMWGTTATTLLGFGSIAFSPVPGLASMGRLVVAGMVAAFLATLVGLPALLGGRRRT